MITKGEYIIRAFSPLSNPVIAVKVGEGETDWQQIAQCHDEDEANLLATLANSAQEINPSNPMAVAEGMVGLVEALEKALEASHNPIVEKILIEALSAVKEVKGTK